MAKPDFLMSDPILCILATVNVQRRKIAQNWVPHKKIWFCHSIPFEILF